MNESIHVCFWAQNQVLGVSEAMPVDIAICYARNANYLCIKGLPSSINEYVGAFLGNIVSGPMSWIVTVEQRCSLLGAGPCLKITYVISFMDIRKVSGYQMKRILQ